MVIHIADPETDAMVRELARRWNTTMTRVVRISVIHALKELKCDRAWAARRRHPEFFADLKRRLR
jgi:hypothetical protein